MNFDAIRKFFKQNPRMWIVVALGVLVSGVVALAVFGGFGLEIGKFFAAELTPTPTALPEPTALPVSSLSVATPATVATAPEVLESTLSAGGVCPVIADGSPLCQPGITNNCVPYCGGQCPLGDIIGSPAYLLRHGDLDLDPVSGLLFNWRPGLCDYTQWFWNRAPTSQADWCNPDFVLERVSAPPTMPVFPNSSVTRCFNGGSGGLDYSSFPTCGPAVCGPGQTIPPTPVPTPIRTPTPTPPTPTPIPIPTPTPSPTPVSSVVCSPDTQTVAIREIAVLRVSGGDGKYMWDVTGGGFVENGGSEDIAISYTVAGTKYVRVTSGGAEAVCTVLVMPAGTTQPQIDGELTVQKQVVPAEGTLIASGTTVQFTITVKSVSTRVLHNLIVKDEVPAGMSYQAGSTFVEGKQVIDTITTFGLRLGTLLPGDSFTIKWSAIANRTDQLAVGPQQVASVVQVRADEISPITDDVVLQIQGTGIGSGTSGGVGTIPTGPGDAVAVALAAALGLTLLYGGYTRSPFFRRKEAEKISRDQGPLDFRS